MKARWVVKDKLNNQYLNRLEMDSSDSVLIMEWSGDRKDAIRFSNIAMAEGAMYLTDQHIDVSVFRLRPVRR